MLLIVLVRETADSPNFRVGHSELGLWAMPCHENPCKGGKSAAADWLTGPAGMQQGGNVAGPEPDNSCSQASWSALKVSPCPRLSDLTSREEQIKTCMSVLVSRLAAFTNPEARPPTRQHLRPRDEISLLCSDCLSDVSANAFEKCLDSRLPLFCYYIYIKPS